MNLSTLSPKDFQRALNALRVSALRNLRGLPWELRRLGIPNLIKAQRKINVRRSAALNSLICRKASTRSPAHRRATSRDLAAS